MCPTPVGHHTEHAITRGRHILFFGVAFGFSWTLWLTAIAGAQGWISHPLNPGPLGSFGPALGGLAVAWRYGAPYAPRELLRSLFRFGGQGRWVWTAGLLPVLITAVALLADAAAQGALRTPVHLERLLYLPLLVPVIAVLGGPFGEEPGWRGYLVAVLRPTHGVLVTSTLVAAAWLIWHLPLFWLEGAAQSGGSILRFGLLVLAYSALFTRVYLETAPSLGPVVMLHTSINVCSFGLPFVLPGLDGSTAYELAYLVAAFGAGALACHEPSMARLRRSSPAQAVGRS